MNIIQLVSSHHWQHKLCRSRFLAINPLNPQRTGNDWPGYMNYTSVAANLENIYGELPDAVVAYKASEHEGFCDLKCPTIIQVNEVKPSRFQDEIFASQPSGVVFHHVNDFRKWFDWLGTHGIKSCHIPHVADPDIFMDRNLDKKYDFMLVGALSKSIYPLRTKFLRAFPLLAAKGYRVKILQHPGHEFNDASTCDHLYEFSRAVNRSRVTCFCSSIYKYRLAKFPEVAASGSAIAADIPRSEDVIPICEMHVNDSPEEVCESLIRCLDNTCCINRHAGIEYAKHHTPKHYSNRLVEFIKTL